MTRIAEERINLLHIGNIANNAYNNAKLLRRVGIEADAISCDYRHVMAQPEWEDAEITGTVDEFEPDWSSVDLGGFVRPGWFSDLELKGLDANGDPLIGFGRLRYAIEIRKTGAAQALERVGLHRNPGEGWTWPKSAIGKARAALLLPQAAVAYALGRLNTGYEQSRASVASWSKAQRSYVEGMLATGEIHEQDLKWALPAAAKLRRVLGSYALVQAYGTEPISAMLCSGGRPYIAFEHGTLRDLPFEPSPRGRLLAQAYKRAARVVITNPDSIYSARRLGLDNYLFIPHPIDEDARPALESGLGEDLRLRFPGAVFILAPSRQNWALKGNDRMLVAFSQLLRSGRRAVLLLAQWGQETDRSKGLIKSLGIGDDVIWFPPVHRRRLLEYYQCSDLVLDQFVIGSFGGIAPQAMACGKPVVLHYDDASQDWAFPEKPPIVQAESAEDLFSALTDLCDDARRRRELGDAGVRWVERQHGWRTVVERHLGMYREILGRDLGPGPAP